MIQQAQDEGGEHEQANEMSLDDDCARGGDKFKMLSSGIAQDLHVMIKQTILKFHSKLK